MTIENEPVADAVPYGIAALAMFVAVGIDAMLALPVIAMSFAIVLKIKLVLRRRKQSEKDFNDAISAFKTMHHKVGKGMPFASSISDVFSKMGSSAVGRALNAARERILLGQLNGDAILEECAKLEGDVSEALCRLGVSHTDQMQGKLIEVANEMERKRATKAEVGASALNKYLLLSTVANTILPSLAIFAFVGYSILYYSAPSLLGFSLLLLLVFPTISSLIRAKVGQVYDE